jgi:hypothetical protein
MSIINTSTIRYVTNQAGETTEVLIPFATWQLWLNSLQESKKLLANQANKTSWLRWLADHEALWQNLTTDLSDISLDEVIAEIENTPQNPHYVKPASGLLAEHLLSSPYLPDPEFNVQQWNETWDKIELNMKQLEQADQATEVSLNHYD